MKPRLSKEQMEEVINFFANLEMGFFYIKEFSDFGGERGAMTAIYDHSERMSLLLDNRAGSVIISVGTDEHDLVYETQNLKDVEKFYDKLREYKSQISYAQIEKSEGSIIINPMAKMSSSEMRDLVSQLDEILAK